MEVTARIGGVHLRNADEAFSFHRMALLFAMRRDWAPYPKTQPWQPAMRETLFALTRALHAEATAIAGEAKEAR